jgi:hypothetical protein
MSSRDELLRSAVKTAGALQEFLGLIVDQLDEDGPVVEPEKKTTKKKTAKKTTKKKTTKKAEEAARKFFDKDNPPVTPTERNLFQDQWDALGKDGQTEYLDGYINSLGEELKAKPVEDDLDDLEELDDLSGGTDLTLEDIKTAAQSYAKENGKPAVVAVFKEYGYSKISETQPVHFEAIYAELT